MAAATNTDSQDRTLTRAEVEANPYLLRQIRNQAAMMLEELAEDGEVWWTGKGYHRTLVPIRAFALRVLVAKGFCTPHPTDTRVHFAA